MTKRRHRIERLENRIPLHMDANLDGFVSAADALLVVNYIARNGETAAEVGENLDVNLDRKISPLDALVVVNRIADPPASRQFTIRLGNIETHGLSRDQVMWAISQAVEDYHQIIDVQFRITTEGNGYYRLSSKELQLGNGLHAKGLANAVGGRYMWFHNGIVTDQPDRCQPCYWDKLWSGNPETLRKVVRHEIGHAVFSINLGGDRHGHSNDTNCIMHSNGSASWFSDAEIDYLQSQWGKA